MNIIAAVKLHLEYKLPVVFYSVHAYIRSNIIFGICHFCRWNDTVTVRVGASSPQVTGKGQINKQMWVLHYLW